MSLYKSVITELKRDDYTTEFYRFQGAKSFEYFDIRTGKFTDNQRESYVYFSGSLDHHKYFTNKRIKQLLNKVVLEETPYQISNNDLRNPESIKEIKSLILNSDKLKDLYSVKLITDSSLQGLIKENCFFQERKMKGRTVEKVDRRVYGGGYGAAEEWKELLSCLTYFSAYQKISREDIIEILTRMRRTGKINQKENLNFLLGHPDNYNFELNPDLESDFTKYKIRNALEMIIEKGLFVPTSELGKHPEETIKTVLNHYEEGRGKVLLKLDKCSKK